MPLGERPGPLGTEPLPIDERSARTVRELDVFLLTNSQRQMGYLPRAPFSPLTRPSWPPRAR